MIVLVVLTYLVKCVTSSEVYSGNGAGLMVVPDDIPSDTTHLHLINNAITEIFETDFAHLDELLELALGGNPIIAIHVNAFMNNNKMTHLYLNYTQLTAPPELSGAIHSLQHFRMNNAKIKNISDDYFSHMSSLHMIVLDSNELSAITIGNLPNLRYICIRYNMLSTMPELRAVLPKLTHMYLHHNQIVNISHAYFNNTPVLVILHMDHNLLTSLPNFEPVLGSIRYIYIRNNHITSQNTEQITAMPQLYDILLSNNKLTNITIGKSDTLWRMYVQNNQLTEMPTLTHPLPALTHLYASSNEHLSHIPLEYFNKTPELTHLWLFYNNLYTIPNLTYCSDTLEHLDLYDTELVYSNLHYEDFTLGRNFTNESHIFNNLKYLRLSQNDITKFSSDFFDGFPNLKTFDCEYIGLTEFPDISRLSG